MKKFLGFAILFLTIILPECSLAQAGALDHSFNPVSSVFTQGLLLHNELFKSLKQPDGKIIITGTISNYSGLQVNASLIRINTNGTIDQSFNAGLISGSLGMIEDMALQQDGKIIIGGYFTSYNGIARNHIARLNADGSLDNSFDPGTGVTFPLQEDRCSVHSILVEGDGKIIITGAFTKYNDIARSAIARLNSDGSLNNSFDPGASFNFIGYPGLDISSATLQNDGKILLSGLQITTIGSSEIVRVNQDGSIDNSFAAPFPASGSHQFFKSVVQPGDGRIIVYGNFLNDTAGYSIARLNTDGSIDNSFNIGRAAGYVNFIRVIRLQPDGKIILAGNFDAYGYEQPFVITPGKIVRLFPNGNIDSSFTIPVNIAYPNEARMVEVQENKKLVIGYDNIHDSFLIKRFNTDGSLDAQTADGPNAIVRTTAIQSDGKIIIGGDFTNYNAIARKRIARVNTDGSLDESFDPQAGFNTAYSGFHDNDVIHASAIQSDGKILVGGYFPSYNGTPRNGIVRLNAD